MRLKPVPQVSKASEPIYPVRGASLPPSRAPQPAKWQMWSRLPICALWEAVCLTYDIEPDGERHDLSRWLETKRGVPHEFPTDFADRLRVAQANVSTQGPHPFKLRLKRSTLMHTATPLHRAWWSVTPPRRTSSG